jgi:molybdopterin-containing oxidoreductase family iron-sulfur binding subunit
MSGSGREGWAAKLRGAEGLEYWRALSELLDTEEFRAEAVRALPALGEVAESAAAGGVGRRDFLKLIGASLALTGLTACLEEPHKAILPYTVRPPEVTPGNRLYYATTMVLDGFGTGLLVESREGRPTKVEGNPEHPASLGAAGVYEQASVLQLYDPHRARHFRFKDRVRSTVDFAREYAPTSTASFGRADSGAGLHFLLEPTSSPLTAELIARVRDAYPAAGFTFYSPISSPMPLEGARAAFGRPLQPVYDLSEAAVMVSLDADILESVPFNLRYARQFADGRLLPGPTSPMNRLYVAEAAFSVTGGIADHRLRVRSSEVAGVAAALLREVQGGGGGGASAREGGGMPSGVGSSGEAFQGSEWVRAAARDQRENPGRGLVVVGERQPAEVHALAHALNALLGNAGRTVRYIEPLLVDAGEPTHSPEPLVAALRAGAIRRLVIVGGNPVYDMPADYQFGELLDRIPERVYCGLYRNETGERCDWMLPGLHYLESWGDARAWDGTASIVQPLINPLYGGMTVDDVLKVFLWEAAGDVHQMLWESWSRRAGMGGDFDVFWAQSVQRGVIPGTAAPEVVAAGALPGGATAGGTTPGGATPGAASALELSFRRDPKVYDGRFADNGWLQELPEPVTKQTWGNAAILAPETAERLDVGPGDMVELRYRERTLLIPALVIPGQAEGEVTVNLGYSRQGSERLASGVGSNAYWLRYSDAPWLARGVELRRVGETSGVERVATTQTEWVQWGRPIALRTTLAEYRENPDFTEEQRGPQPTLYESWEYSGDQWAMTIDLSVCTGCSACVVACQAENNSPVVGKNAVLRNREMHWLRIDRYFSGEGDATRLIMQPMMCQHCENAPCEYVCPVNATVHSSDGLNEMVYNRCVGTRFCSNNCPYKVRRFNFFDYNSLRPPAEEMQLNPDVTVRARGVMEKCTYCVQRIRRAGIDAQIAGRELRDGEVMTACQQTCPTRAIIFGSLGDSSSEVSRSRTQPRLYSVLHDLGTVPRTRYLARITNPAPGLGEG